ncbi:MAG TPA: hypothetical protein QF353_01720 [Gammaproteobacteria bacterium]|nr:hypothetical protein [Gammaproteobacteria bacterium]
MSNNSKKTLHIVHCVDAEGPLEETLEATFQRIESQFSINIEPTLNNLNMLQNRDIPLNGVEHEIAEFISTKRLAYLSTWNDVEKMLSGITTQEFRSKYSSPDGTPYTYSWFVIDVVGYKNNPRRKSIGFNVVWEQYARILKNKTFNDSFGWHFHSVSPAQEALEYSTTWSAHAFHEQCLARRLIKHKHFPALFRAGGVVERNDISYWLERTIPFDYSNQNKDDQFSPGDQSDWRGSPKTWGGYHPCFYDYRKEGNMRRSVFRCIDVSTPGCSLTDLDVEQAFIDSIENNISVFSYTNHDRRDITLDIENVYAKIRKISQKYPEVNWKFSNALEAARSYRCLNTSEIRISASIDKNTLTIKTNIPTFSGDLFLCFEEEGELFYRDNPTIEDSNMWVYKLNRKNHIKNIGIAATSSDGSTDCVVINLDKR